MNNFFNDEFFLSTLYEKPKTRLTMTQVRNTEPKHSEEGHPLTQNFPVEFAKISQVVIQVARGRCKGPRPVDS